MFDWSKRPKNKKPKKESNYKFKQVIVVRTDLGMSKGKIAAQVAHGAVRASRLADETVVNEWFKTGEAKIVLRVENKQKLFALFALAELIKFPAALIFDEGLTEIEPSYTVLAIGPADRKQLDLLTGELKTL